MTTPEQIKYITERCIAANPSILDLVFGCEIICKYDYAKIYSENIMLDDVGDKYVNVSPTLQGNDMIYIDDNNFEIIGREIRLADVLLAINNRGEQIIGWHMSTTGHFYKTLMNGSHIAQSESWNLLSDSLSSQSPETIAFLYELLLGNKE